MLYKAELLRRVALSTRLHPEMVSDVWNAMEKEIGRALASGESVQLTGFCVLDVEKQKTPQLRNFQTGKIANGVTTNVVRFRTGETLRKAINGRRKIDWRDEKAA